MTALYKVSQNRKMANYILGLLMVALLSFISVCAETPLRAACGPPVEHFIEKSKGKSYINTYSCLVYVYDGSVNLVSFI